MRWLIRITAWPAAFSRPMRSSTSATCRTLMAAVGSSISTIFGSESRVRAIATACRWPPDICLTRSRGRVSDFSSAKSSPARAYIAERSRKRNGPIRRVSSRPRKTLSAAGRLSQSARSWWTISMPFSRASSGRAKRTGSPSSSISPAEGAKLPAMILTSVDLPAPLSPISPSTSPRPRSRSIPCSAWMAPKCLEMPRRLRTGGITPSDARRRTGRRRRRAPGSGRSRSAG